MTLGLYLSRVLGLRILGAGAVLLALGVSLDLIRVADDLVASGGGGALAQYAALRAPALAASVLPVAVLVGAATGFLSLGNRSELIVMRAAGQSVFAMLRRLLPLALLLGLVQHLLADRAVGWSEAALGEAFGPVVGIAAPEPGARVMARQGREVVIGRLERTDGTALAPVTVFSLDEGQQITSRIEADRAHYADGAWVLEGARRFPSAGPAGPLPLRWDPALTPATIRDLAGDARTAAAPEAAAALAGRAVATRSRAYYETRIARAAVALALPAVMLLFAAFASFKVPRSSAGLSLAAIGLAGGLGFIAVDGLFASLGMVGLLPAPIAAFAPSLLVAVLGGWALLMMEE